MTEIEGVGKKRARELLAKFKSIDAIKKAGFEELSLVLPNNVAERVMEYFRNKEE